MKLRIEKTEFNRWWQFAERVTSAKNTISSLGGVLCTVSEESVILEATDLKTALRCVPHGISADETGTVILPAKLLGELFKKVPVEEFSIEIKGEKGTLLAGKNKTRFTTWTVGDFPKIPSPESASVFCEILAGDLLRVINEGIVASSQGESFPTYLGTCFFHVRENVLSVVSTDSHRLALSKADCVSGSDVEMLLPVMSVKELQRLLSNVISDVKVSVMTDGAVSWFRMGNIEFSIRRVEASFPNYAKILNPKKTTTLVSDRNNLLGALDRIDVVVRDFTRVVVMKLSPSGELKLSGKSPNIGVGIESLDANITGEPITVGFNLSYLLDGLKAFRDVDIQLSFDGSSGQVTMMAPNRDDFLYMTMPVKISDEDEVENDFDEPEDAEASEGNAEPEPVKSTKKSKKSADSELAEAPAVELKPDPEPDREE
ncbi:MAG: DNA polymerase III subunit beta [Synergistaceae bacterium]|nr:DNA polymerase III subunit beta [Synergistaceae bacterium]